MKPALVNSIQVIAILLSIYYVPCSMLQVGKSKKDKTRDRYKFSMLSYDVEMVYEVPITISFPFRIMFGVRDM